MRLAAGPLDISVMAEAICKACDAVLRIGEGWLNVGRKALPCPRFGVKPDRSVCNGRRDRDVVGSGFMEDPDDVEGMDGIDEDDGMGGVDIFPFAWYGSSHIIAATGTLVGYESSGNGRFFPIVLVVVSVIF